MISRRTPRLLLRLGLTLLGGSPAAAQSMAYSGAADPPRVATASAYYVRLESAWPQASAPDESCRNGGEEVVEGSLARGADGVYLGSFDRRTLMLFCGAHGAGGEACELVLEGEGRVAMTGYVVPDASSPSGSALRLSWQPSPGHAVTVRGPCSTDFKRAVEEMYLSVTHAVELGVPAAGKRRERLKDYAWTVEVAGW